MTLPTDRPYVQSQTAEHITTIEFFHPQKNALPAAILAQLADAIYTAGNSPESNVIILRAGGEKVFCAGASFDELVAVRNEQEGLAFFSGFATLLNAMRTCPKLVIGRIHGKCAGGGVGIAAACDYAFATNDAAIKLSELAIGIGPFVVGPAIERKMGLAAFSQLAINASAWQTASWAMAHGLFNEVCTSDAELDNKVLELAHSLSVSNPAATLEIKKMLWQHTDHWDELLTERAAISGRLVLSEHTKTAIAAFKSKSR